MPARTGTVVVVGLGNIGAPLCAEVARISEVTQVVVVDPDHYDATNLSTQAIDAADVGRAKATAQAGRMRRIRPGLPVIALAERVEHVPLGSLRADVILAALDSRAARQHVAAAAWRLGVPLIDAGVFGEGLLARVNVYLPGPDAPCLECAWDDDDYALVAEEYPCAGRTAARTNAPASLGTLAAALEAIECRKLLRGEDATLAQARQVTLDATWHQLHVTRLGRNPRCRFDHATWSIASLGVGPEALSLGALLGQAPDLRLGCPPQAFATGLVCLRCGTRREITVHLADRLRARERVCSGCGGEMRPPGTDLHEWLSRAAVPANVHELPLDRLGFRPGDVVTVTEASHTRHLELGGAHA